MDLIKIITIINRPSGVDYTSHLVCSCGTRTELDTNYAMESKQTKNRPSGVDYTSHIYALVAHELS